MLPDPTVAPDLPWSVEARILLALQARILADTAFAAFVSNRVFFCELRALIEQESFVCPALGLCVLADEEREFTSSYGGVLETVVQLVLLTNMPQGFGLTDDFLRSRAAAALRRIVRANRGSLVDGDGVRLTEAVTVINRVNYDLAPIGASNVLITLINVKFRSQLDLATQEVVS